MKNKAEQYKSFIEALNALKANNIMATTPFHPYVYCLFDRMREARPT